MKFIKKIAITTLIALSIGTSGIVWAHGRGGPNKGAGCGFRQQQETAGPGRALREEMAAVRIEAIVEVTEQSSETIKAKLKNKPVWAVLDEFKVDFATFQAKMHEKVGALIQQAVADGKITQEQADFMAERRKDGPRQGWGGRGRGRGWGHGGGFGRGFGCDCPGFQR